MITCPNCEEELPDEKYMHRKDELVKEMLRKDALFDFHGDEYCDKECRGWDGYSHRCECGNRRIEWKYDEQYDRVYPEAY